MSSTTAPAVVPGVNLITDGKLTTTPQVVKDPDGTESALQLAKDKVLIADRGIVTLPVYSLQVGARNSIRFELKDNQSMLSLGAPGEFNVDAVDIPRGRFTVTNQGRVGINKPTPDSDAILDVNGTIKATGLKITGPFSISGMQGESKSPDPKRLQPVFIDPQTGTLYYHGS